MEKISERITDRDNMPHDNCLAILSRLSMLST